ncbi:MAG: hypothetical protein KDA24_08860 [Deltaproteobacteria bacterium]|nr:hypothetical protein [Deltaproteobacteria bacterium]
MDGGPFSRWRRARRRQLHAFPIGPEGELPWHSTPGQVRSILTTHKAASSNIGGMPSARMRWPDRTLRATLEFADGICLGPRTFLSSVPGCDYARRDGTRVGLGPQLRAANVYFERSNPRGNWKWVVGWLGKPTERLPDGSWSWTWDDMTARYYEANPTEDEPEWMRFAATAQSRALEIVNQSSLELYSKVSLRLDFRAGTWLMGTPPQMVGIPTRLHWDTPQNEVLLLTAVAEGIERSAQISRRAHRVVLTNSAEGGVRIVV